MIYADHAATTRLSPAALTAMMPYLEGEYGNPSSLYAFAGRARTALEVARGRIADLLHARPEELFFTSGGTESDNWALRGVADALGKRGKHILVSAVEHHAVLHTARALSRQGFEVEYLPVDQEGRVQPETLERALREDTILVSVMLANNEIGTIQPIRVLTDLAHARGVLFHTDAVQAVGHIPVDVEALGVDLLSLSGHKFGGPRGMGALYVRKGTPLLPLLHGGGQERNRRPGTEPVALIVGMAAALEESCHAMEAESTRLSALRDDLIQEVLTLPGAVLTGPRVGRLPGLASFAFSCVEGESILLRMDAKGVCVSSGSACSSASLEPSHVLLATGLSKEQAHGSVRISLGAENTEEEVDYIAKSLKQVVTELRAMSPLWDEHAEAKEE